MRFKSTYRLAKQPMLTGVSKDSRYGNILKDSCHEFSVSDVKCNYDEIGYYSKNTFCDRSSPEQPCDGDCSPCKDDYRDHLVFHRATHTICKFCANIEEHLPQARFVIRQTKGSYGDFHEHLQDASVLDHWATSIEPTINSSDKFQCDKCSIQFTRKSDLKKHEVAVHYGKKFECSYCGLKFTRDDNLEQHKNLKHYNQDASRYKCDVCDQEFGKKSNLLRHSKGKQACDLCDVVFCTLKQVQQHKRLLHPAYSCAHCRKPFPNKAYLNQHVERAKNEDGSLKNKCDYCSESFCTRLDLTTHLKSDHHPGLLTECAFCDKPFSSKDIAETHMANRVKVLCPDCGKTFCNKVNFRDHKLSCPDCIKIFCNRVNFRDHCRIAHEIFFGEA